MASSARAPFAMMPRGAMPVNVGRGKHVVDRDLIKALDSGQLSYAALDALWPEPLPSDKPSGAPDRIGHAYRR
jgi:glyoxylate/hydroxypyruvate reductase A